ncbi:MAG TPA: triose-phosphate isomerase [Candidatus Dormibacteraeota bacterium]|nr:triose-phosphate isomerase [Candidatus Dormibacteraeota bacterium]
MTTSRPLVAGNWKMHLTPSEGSSLATEILARLPRHSAAEVLLLPPFTCLSAVGGVLAGDTRVGLGAQNCHWEPAGAVTGEISAPMLAGLCQYVLVGHSERRQLFHETDSIVRAKLESVLRAGMSPILAVGETGEERQAGLTRAVLLRQAKAGLVGLERAEVLRCTVAYEPVWAIGAGAAAEAAEITEAAIILRSVIEEAAHGGAGGVRILYGGSVTSQSAAQLLGAPGIAGALVGGASLRAADFCGIVAATGR